ncbi:hypothetical protein psyc5s11_19100 [Clostridium gelidum]|uniref:Uncharacterized protein n=1 Tax=Clostridium gelidum TaxID=704125 RepID=A0ABM7T2J4_9CLOT|nr:hypothetical protein psyc5s11_19100 [Clostridium gelidum]
MIFFIASYEQVTNYSEYTNHIPYRILIIITENENYNMISDRINEIPKKNNFRIIVEQRSRIKYLNLD